MVVPAILDLAQVPYTGSPALSLGLALHKDKAKELLRAREVPTPDFRVVHSVAEVNTVDLPWPLIVKPSREDASIGIDFDSVVKDKAQLGKAVGRVLRTFHQPALVERYIEGHEVYVPLLGNAPRRALPLSQVKFGPAFTGRPALVTYRAKWESGSPECVDSNPVPCELPAAVQRECVRVAMEAFGTTGASICASRPLASATSSTSTPTATFTPKQASPEPQQPLASAIATSPCTSSSSHWNEDMEIRPLAPADRAQLADLLARIETFTPPEVACALELIDLALDSTNKDYQVLVAVREGKVVGYVCFGPTPMTDGTFDLYWIASAPEARGQGVGAGLVSAMEGDIRRHKGRLIRVETSAMEAYGPTRGFYASMQYREESRFRDFYRVGEDLIILAKRL
jgi:ribosomal protein S18 acetylase RimI-like enzyme